MGKIILFRGKAATGKTLITDILGKELNIAIIRKDDIYDSLWMYHLEHSTINRISCDIMAEIIQTNIDTDCDLIIDISLAHNPYLEQFLSKIEFKGSKLYQFLCICSDDREWGNRLKSRFDNPKPNQLFKSVKEAEEHYNQYHTEPFEHEIVLDSAKDVSIIMGSIYEALKN
ncbi:MAG: hypothetical protein GX053_00730 [Tissierella sp.]|nr:hypothetical protein [Tissierella sp.]